MSRGASVAAAWRLRVSAALLVGLVALLAPAQAGAEPPRPEHVIVLGSKPVAGPTKGATLTCKAAEGGCAVFSPSASAVYPSGFFVPEHGGIVAVVLGTEPVDNYEFQPLLARPVGTGLRLEGRLGALNPFGLGPWGAVSPGGATVELFDSPPLLGGFAAWDQPGYEAKKGQLVGLNVAGPVGPSLELDPGRDSVVFKPVPPLGSTVSAGPLNVLEDLSLQMQVVLEREAALRAHSAWAFPDPKRGFRQGAPFKLLVIAQNTSRKAAARDAIASIGLRGRPFRGLNKLGGACQANACLNVGTVPAVGQKGRRPYRAGATVIVPKGRGVGAIDVVFETQTIENDQSTLANNRGSFRIRFKRKRGRGGRAPRCGKLRLGTPRRDRLNGSRRPDTLVGLQAADRLWGRGADDCLAGSAGADAIWGNAGNDVILGDDTPAFRLGKPGADRIVPGPGRDYVEAGPANDLVLSRDGTPDIVDCGPGRRDRVEADRFDRLRGCEIRL